MSTFGNSHIGAVYDAKGPGKRGHFVADTLLPTQMFPHLPARATFVADSNFVSGTQKRFLILFKTFCVRNNVSLFASTLTAVLEVHTNLYCN